MNNPEKRLSKLEVLASLDRPDPEQLHAGQSILRLAGMGGVFRPDYCLAWGRYYGPVPRYIASRDWLKHHNETRKRRGLYEFDPE